MSLGLRRRHFLLVFVGHVFPEGEGRDETLAAHHAQIWHAPVLTVRVGHVNGEPVLLGKLLGAERARETAATTGPVHAEHVLVERLLVGVSSGAKVAFERVVRVLDFGCVGRPVVGQGPSAPQADTPSAFLQVTLEVVGPWQRQVWSLTQFFYVSFW